MSRNAEGFDGYGIGFEHELRPERADTPIILNSSRTLRHGQSSGIGFVNLSSRGDELDALHASIELTPTLRAKLAQYNDGFAKPDAPQPQPELVGAVDPFQALHDATAPGPEAQEAYRQLCDAEVALTRKATIGNPRALLAAEDTLSLYGWLVSGKPGEPLPSHRLEKVSTWNNSSPVTRIVQVHADPGHAWQATAARRLESRLSDHLRATITLDAGEKQLRHHQNTQLVAAALQASPGYHYLQRLEQPVMHLPEEPLPEGLKDALRAGIAARICEERGIPHAALSGNTGARLQYGQETRYLEHAMRPATTRVAAELMGFERVRTFLAAELSRYQNRMHPDDKPIQLRPDEIIFNLNNRSLILQDPTRPLEGALRELVHAATGSRQYQTPEWQYVRQRVESAFMTNAHVTWDQDVALQQVASNAGAILADSGGQWASPNAIALLSWVRQTPLEEAPHSTELRSSFDTVPVSRERHSGTREESERAQSAVVGEILYDGREKPDVPRLILRGPADETLLLHSSEAPLLTIVLTEQVRQAELGTDMPLVPGMRLTATRTGSKGWEYDFVADTSQPDPYLPSDMSCEPRQWGRTANTAEELGYRLLSAAIRNSPDHTLDAAGSQMRATADYAFPSAGKPLVGVDGRPALVDGRMQVQCHQAAEVYVSVFAPIADEMHVIGGLEIPGTKGVITAAGHAQVSAVQDGVWRIIDPTPAGQPGVTAEQRAASYAQTESLDLEAMIETMTPTELNALIASLGALIGVDRQLTTPAPPAVPPPTPASQPPPAPALPEAARPLPQRVPQEAVARQPVDERQAAYQRTTGTIAQLNTIFLQEVRAQFGLERHPRLAHDQPLWRHVASEHAGRHDAIGILARHLRRAQPQLQPLTDLSDEQIAERAHEVQAAQSLYSAYIADAAARKKVPGRPQYSADRLRAYSGILQRLGQQYQAIQAIRNAERSEA